jgi:hypothetical protein
MFDLRIHSILSRRVIVLLLCFYFTLLHAASVQSHASVTPVHKARLSSPSLLLVSTISGDTHVLRARDGSGAHRTYFFKIVRRSGNFCPCAELWTLRGARVSVSTFQRENFFGYKLAPALDGLHHKIFKRHLFMTSF